jgi:hypothetical protein
MAKDTFDITGMQSQIEALRTMSDVTKQTESGIHDMTLAMQTYAQTYANLPELSIVDPEKAGVAKELLKDLTTELIKQEVSIKELVSIRKKEMQLLGAEFVDMQALTREGQKRAKIEAENMKKGEKFVKIKGQIVKVGGEELRDAKGTASAFASKGKALAKYAAGMANIQLSLAGIIALIIELWNIERKIGAIQKQVVSQWGDAKDNIAAAGKELSWVRYSMKKSWDVAQAYVGALTQAGFEKEHLVALSKELMAVETVYGQSVQEQVKYVKGLVTNFDLTARASGDYLSTIRETAKTIPMLSMSEAVDDVAELIDKTKVYNTDLLGTLALYNTLIRKDVAKKIGLGEAPRAVRKEIVQTITGFSQELEDGYKAALGKGATAAARIINFEMMSIPEQFSAMAEFITKRTQGFMGENREFAVRQHLKQFGFTSEQTRKVLAKAFAEGGFDEAGLKGFMAELGKQKEGMKVAAEKARADRENLIKKATEIAWGLTSAIELLKNWLEMELLPIFRDIRDYLRELVAGEIAPERLEDISKGYKGGMAERYFGIMPTGQKEKVMAGIEQTPVYKRMFEKVKREHPGTILRMGREASEKVLGQQSRRGFLGAAERGAPTKEAFLAALQTYAKTGEEAALNRMTTWARKGARNRRLVKGSHGKGGGNRSPQPVPKTKFTYKIQG